jgi:capsular exopolysaccharide synthesis family protein
MRPLPADRQDVTLPAVVAERVPAEPRPLPPPGAEDVHLRDYWEILLRYRWTALAFFVIAVASTLFATLVSEPVYKATTLIEIKAENQKVVAFQDVVQVAQIEREFYQTQYDVLRSRSLARRVIERLRLADDPVFNPPATRPGLLAATTAWLGALMTRAPQAGQAGDGAMAEHRLIDRFLDAIDVTPRRNSYLAEVSFHSPDPTLAAAIANALAEEYVGLALDRRLHAVQKGRAFIERQLGVTKAALERSEEELQAFARANEILTVDTKQNIEYRKLGDLNEALTEAQHERMAKESLHRQVASRASGRLSEITNNPVIAELTSALARLEGERAHLGETFTAEFPKVRRLEAQLAALRKKIEAERRALAATLRADFEAAGKQETLLAAALQEQKKIVNDLNQRSIDYKILKREVDTNRTIYNSLLRRLKEVEVTAGIEASNIQVIDPAEVPLGPDRPRPLLNLALAVLVGAFGGVGLAFFRERLDNSIKTPEDVERHLRAPTLGVVPQLRTRRANGRSADGTPELVVAEDPKSAGAEALRMLRASLFLATAAGPPQRLLVTSTRPEEGKTCVTINLALVLAQMGRRVVLVDCDFRRPRIHRVFGLDLERGATSFLTGSMDLGALIHTTPYGIDVLPSGPMPPNPVELIDSALMASLLEELSHRYDFLLLDAPPAVGFADVPLLARLAGGVLFVVRAGDTSRKGAAQAIEYLRRLRAKLLGVVLNGVRTGDPGSYSAYYGHYSYYGSGENGRGRAAERPLLSPAET